MHIPGIRELRAVMMASDNPQGAEGALLQIEEWAASLNTILRSHDDGLFRSDPTHKQLRAVARRMAKLSAQVEPTESGAYVQLTASLRQVGAQAPVANAHMVVCYDGKSRFELTKDETDQPAILGMTADDINAAYPGLSVLLVEVGNTMAEVLDTILDAEVERATQSVDATDAAGVTDASDAGDAGDETNAALDTEPLDDVE